MEDVNRKMLNTIWLVKKSDCKTKIAEIQNKIISITCLVTAAANKDSLNTKAPDYVTGY